MVDIAEIGFKAETSVLDKATLSLTKLKAAAKGVSTATNKVSRDVASAAVAVAGAKTAEANAILKSFQATEKASKADLKKASMSLKVAKSEEAKTKSLLKEAVAAEKLTQATLRLVEAEKRQGMSRRAISAAAGGVSLDRTPNRFNTANVAAQFQDIGVTAAMGMNPLTVALQQGTQLSAILNSMKNPLQGLKVAFMSVFNAVSLGTIAIIALVVSLIQFVNWTKFAKNALNGLADGIEVIGPFAIMAAAGLALFYSPAIIVGLAKVTRSIVVMGAKTLIAGIKMAAAWVLANPLMMLAALAVVAVGIAVWAVNAFKPFREFVNRVMSLFAGLKDVLLGFSKFIWAKTTFGDTSEAEKQMEKGGERIAIAFQIGVKKGTNAEDFVGGIGKGVDKAIASIVDKFRKLSASIGANAKAFKELVNGAERTIITLTAQGEALTMNSFAAEQLTRETQLLNEAKQKNIKLTPEQTEKIKQLSIGMATLSEENRKLKDSIQFARSTTRGFFSDMRNGLMQGKSAWETFGNAVNKVLDKILDKMLNIGVDMLFAAFGAGSFNAPARVNGAPTPVAKPGRFARLFDKGGVFTNSVVNRPTPFAFASGGSFGVMGEAGPEAVMPLKRGPDGSLGVQMFGSKGGGGNVIVNVNNNSNANASVQQRQTSQGVEIDVIIDEIVSEKLATQGTATNRSINAFNSRQLIKRG